MDEAVLVEELGLMPQPRQVALLVRWERPFVGERLALEVFDGLANVDGGGQLQVPSTPIIPFIEGDGVGPDIWRASQAVFDVDDFGQADGPPPTLEE